MNFFCRLFITFSVLIFGHCLNVEGCPSTSTTTSKVPNKPQTAQVPCPQGCVHGACLLSNNACICDGGWTGITCSSPICDIACVHGNCTGAYRCTCEVGWMNAICSTPICREDCGYGNCSVPFTCDCYPGYSGNNCLTTLCNPPCASPGGTCLANQTCQCSGGWTGSICAIPVCSPSCSNGGTCSAPGTCTCPATHNGTTCSNPVCASPCLNGGTCSAPSTCTCPVTYNGTTCASPICNTPCLNGGTCTAPDTCTCLPTYNGTACSSPVCSSPCLNGGTCTAPGTCTCPATYNGTTCSNAICNNPCLNGGTCSAPDTCACPATYNGTTCSNPVCSSQCLNGGTCSAPSTCSCPATYNGTTCNNAICNNPCQNGGTCSAPDTCTCPATYNGTTCANPVCTNPCLNGATCTAPDTCICATGYNGTACASPLPQFATNNAVLPTLLGYWPLNAKFGLQDLSGNGMHFSASSNVLVTTTGPYQSANGAYLTNDGGVPGYITLTSPTLETLLKTATSYTVSIFTYFPTDGPIIEFGDNCAAEHYYHITHLWNFPAVVNEGVLHFNTEDGYTSRMACDFSKWQFVGFMYANASGSTTVTIFDTSTMAAPITAVPLITQQLNIGARPMCNGYPIAKFACLSIYGGALTTEQLAIVRQQCSVVNEITCPQNCVAGTCTEDLTQQRGCPCTCKTGWTGPDCSTPT